MPSNEALELLEQVLSENSRTRYLQMQVDKLKDLKEKQDQKEKELDKAREDLDAVKPRLRNIKKRKELNKVLSNKVDEYYNARSEYGDTNDKIGKYSLGKTFSVDPEGDIETVKNAGKNLKDAMERNQKYHLNRGLSYYADEISNSNKGKQAYMKDFGGPDSKYNTIHNQIRYYGDGRGIGKYSPNSGLNNKTREYVKSQLKERIENEKKNPHKVIGGYKLEAMYTITEALDKVLNEYEYNEDGANVICESSCILIEALNTLLSE